MNVLLPMIVCDKHPDSIFGNDTLGTILPHTLDIENGRQFAGGGIILHTVGAWNSTRRTRHKLARCSQMVIHMYQHYIQN